MSLCAGCHTPAASEATPRRHRDQRTPRKRIRFFYSAHDRSPRSGTGFGLVGFVYHGIRMKNAKYTTEKTRAALV
jgi:hypothetical protein